MTDEPMTLLLPPWLRDTFNLARAIAGERQWSWAEGYRLLRSFEMRSHERAFVRTVLTRRTNLWLFRCNQRQSCGDFIAVDMSPGSPADRVARVMELKTGDPLVVGGAHVQLARHRAAIDEIAARTGALGPGAAAELLRGDAAAVLAHIG
jgi:hypothetical protein